MQTLNVSEIAQQVKDSRISVLIKNKPAHGMLYSLKEAKPDALMLSFVEEGELIPEVFAKALTEAATGTLIIDLDMPECRISDVVTARLINFINDGGQVVMVSSGTIHFGSGQRPYIYKAMMNRFRVIAVE